MASIPLDLNSPGQMEYSDPIGARPLRDLDRQFCDQGHEQAIALCFGHGSSPGDGDRVRMTDDGDQVKRSQRSRGGGDQVSRHQTIRDLISVICI